MRNGGGFRQLDLEDLSSGELGLTPAVGGSMAEAASVCLEDEGHGIWLVLTIDGIFEEVFDVRRLVVTGQMRGAHVDPRKATESGACGIAILSIQTLTGLKVLEQAMVGTGFDYWLTSNQGSLPFQGAVQLEVSGVRRGDARSVQARMRQKFRQTTRSGSGFPLFIAVVEFSRAKVRILRRW